MARWYARFDAGNETALDNVGSTEGYFTKLRIGASSASAALLRDGLIASKSALSTDVYADLDAANKNGANGTYFPNDAPGKTINSVTPPTYVSWSNGYSSTLEGIKTPTTNTYGVADSINYSKRPTESVSYSSSAWVTELSPTDPIGVSYATYYSASSAVRAIVDVIQTTGGTVTTPFTRTGTDPSRTAHSLWSNPGTDYFAWDDFTPGQATMTMNIEGLSTLTSPPEVYPGGDPVTVPAIIIFSVDTFQYPNDGNPDGTIGLEIRVETTASSVVGTLALGYNATTHGGPLTIGTDSSGTGPANQSGFPGGGDSSWSWDKDDKELQWTLGLNAGEYTLNCLGRIYDVTISAHSGPATVVTTFPTTATNVFAVRAGNQS